MTTSFAELDALVAILVPPANNIKAEYTRLDQRFPSLQDTTPHPLDSQHNATLKKAAQAIHGACGQLSTLVAPPQYIMHIRANRHIESSLLRLVLECKVADQLKGRPEGVHVSKIATQSGVDEGKMSRILRFLATKHIFREVKKYVFANNRLSALLLSGHPVRAIAAVMTIEALNSVAVLHKVVRDPVAGPSYSLEDAAFVGAFGHSFWNYYLNVDQDRGKRFMNAMVGLSDIQNMDSLIQGFPWKDLPPGTIVCDLGSGVGHMGLRMAGANPGVRVFLQDREETLDEAKVFFQEHAKVLVVAKRIQFVPVNFLKESPVPGCDIYYMKMIMHDWPDEEAKTILSNIKQVMKPSSRVIVPTQMMIAIALLKRPQYPFSQTGEKDASYNIAWTL